MIDKNNNNLKHKFGYNLRKFALFTNYLYSETEEWGIKLKVTFAHFHSIWTAHLKSCIYNSLPPLLSASSMLTRRRMRTVCPPSIVKAFCGDFHIVLVLEFSFGELVFKSLYFILRFQFCCLSPLPQMVYLFFQRDQQILLPGQGERTRSSALLFLLRKLQLALLRLQVHHR